LHQSAERIDELVGMTRPRRLRADELDSKATSLVAKYLGDRAKPLDVPGEVRRVVALVRRRRHERRGAGAAKLAPQRRQSRQRLEVFLPAIVLSPGDRQSPL